MRIRWIVRTGLIVVGAALGLPALASASTVTVGSPLTASFVGGGLQCSPTACTIFNSALGEPGADVSSPVSGTIVRWRMMGTASNGGAFELQVLRPAGGGQYTLAGTSSPMTPAAGAGLSTFATDLPIKAGDTIAIETPAATWNDGLVVGQTGSAYSGWSPPLADGPASTPTFGPRTDAEVAVNADVMPPPAVAAVSPTSGPSSGGTPVVITGHDFTGATEVAFGGVPSSGFTVDSDDQITAVAPPPAGPGTVHIAVTTAAGQTPLTIADEFTYAPASIVQCVVPKLKHDSLSKARQVLSAARCALGIIAKPKHRKGKLVVKSQSPAAGTRLDNGGAVSVKLGPKPHHKKH